MTGQEVERVPESRIDVLPPKQPITTGAIAILRDAADAMEVAHQYARWICATQVCPKPFQGKPDDGAAAILYGLELGLTPAQSLQRVVVIHGMPSLEARTMVGLLRPRGFGFRTYEQSDEVVEIWAWLPSSPVILGEDPDDKKNFGKRINPDAESRWTIERAIRAGYCPVPVEGSQKRPNVKTDWMGETKQGSRGSYYVVDGNMKYITDPQAMLKAKGQAEVSRDLAPDILMGIQYSTEELQSERWDGTLSVEQPRKVAAAVTADEILGEVVPDPEPDPAPAPAPDTPVTPPEPQESRQSTEAMSEQPVAEAPAEPVAPPPEATPEPETTAAQPEQAEPAPEPESDEEPPENAPVKVRQLFALLGKAEVRKREDRLVIFRKLGENNAINSTDDLQTRELNRIVAKLKAWDDAGDIVQQCEEILWAAAQQEADAAEAAGPGATEGK